MTIEILMRNRGIMALIDEEDLALISGSHWYVDGNGYVTSVTGLCKTARIFMHRIIARPGPGLVVDHVNRIKTDNRRCNLRVCTVAENCRNRPVSKNNSSGVSGVWWDENCQRWRAQIRVSKRKINLGAFREIDAAIAARRSGEIEHFGSFAPTHLAP